MPKISVIVPIYNSEQYLYRCVDSILAQSFQNFELILIDDGSKDESGKICDEYASQDPRVRVFHKENGGVSSARNLGLDKAEGEWISFVDSDDWVDPNYLEVLYQNGEYDFVTCYWRLVNDDSYVCVVPKEGIYQGRSEIVSFLDSNIANISFPISRLYRKSIILNNELQFNTKMHCSEDALFNISYLRYVNSIKQVGDIEYNYEKHAGSLSNTFIPWKEMNYSITMLGEQINLLEECYGWDGERLRQYHIWGGLLRKYLTNLQFHQSFLNCRDGLRNIIQNKYSLRCFSPSIGCDKSYSRKMLDLFIRNRRLCLATILLKLECLLIKWGVISRR